MKTLILGLGNPILKDDAVGLIVSRKLYERAGSKHTDLFESEVTGFKILDVISGYNKIVIIDAVKTNDGKVGEIYKFKINDLKMSNRLRSPHDVSLFHAIEIGKKLNMSITDDITIYAIEVNDPYTFGECLTNELETKVEGITLEIFEEECGCARTSYS